MSRSLPSRDAGKNDALDDVQFQSDLVQQYNAALDDLFGRLVAKEFADLDVASEDEYFASFPITESDIAKDNQRHRRYSRLQEFKRYTELKKLLMLSERKSKDDLASVEQLITELPASQTNSELRILAHGLVLFMSSELSSDVVDITALDEYASIPIGDGLTVEGKQSLYKSDLYKEGLGYAAVNRVKTSDPLHQYLFIHEEDPKRKHLLVLSSLIASVVEHMRAAPDYDFADFGLTTNQIMNAWNRLLGNMELDYGGTAGGKHERVLDPRPISGIPQELRYKQIHSTRSVDVYDLYENVMKTDSWMERLRIGR